jgi:hypothetical protein
VSASTAKTIGVLTWSEDGSDLTVAQRGEVGLSGHRRIEKLTFGARVTAQLWERP